MRKEEETPAPRVDAGKGLDYRSPHRVELRYDGLLSTRPGRSDPEALRQLALPNPIFAQHYARSMRVRRRVVAILAWLTVGGVGLFIWDGLRDAGGDAGAARADPDARVLMHRPRMPPPAYRAPPPDVAGAPAPGVVLPAAAGALADTTPADQADAPRAPGLIADTAMRMPAARMEWVAGAGGNGGGADRTRRGGESPREARGCGEAAQALGLCPGEQRPAGASGALARTGAGLP